MDRKPKANVAHASAGRAAGSRKAAVKNVRNANPAARAVGKEIVEARAGRGATVHGATVHGKTVHGKTARGATVHGKTGHGKTGHGKTGHGATGLRQRGTEAGPMIGRGHRPASARSAMISSIPTVNRSSRRTRWISPPRTPHFQKLD